MNPFTRYFNRLTPAAQDAIVAALDFEHRGVVLVTPLRDSAARSLSAYSARVGRTGSIPPVESGFPLHPSVKTTVYVRVNDPAKDVSDDVTVDDVKKWDEDRRAPKIVRMSAVNQILTGYKAPT